MTTAAQYKRNVYVLSFAFFCVFTAFSAIQNLEASVVRSGCKDCNVVCWDGDDRCLDAKQDKVPSDKDLLCSFTTADNEKFCAKYGGECKSTCPNKDGGAKVHILDDMNVTSQPEFKECSGSNVGSIAIGFLYAVFTLCCLIGPYVVDYLGAKWSITTAFFIFSIFCGANFIVAQFPTVIALQWGLLVPASGLVGFAASFLWTAQGAYVTLNANKYAAALNMDEKAVLGTFYGIFFGIFQTTQISGNLAASLLLEKAGWSNSALMLFYLVFAGAGTAFAMLMIPNVSEEADEETTSESSFARKRTLGETVKGMTKLWQDKRMTLLIPIIMYTGAEQGFMWDAFTSNWVKESMGIEKIGYIMAAFGAADMLGSVLFGRLSDVLGRFPIMTFGMLCQLFVLIYLKNLTVGQCKQQWAPLLVCASLWGFGDAVWNTQTSSILGEVFVSKKEDAFSNLKLWQSLATSIIFFLGFNPEYDSFFFRYKLQNGCRTAWCRVSTPVQPVIVPRYRALYFKSTFVKLLCLILICTKCLLSCDLRKGLTSKL